MKKIVILTIVLVNFTFAQDLKIKIFSDFQFAGNLKIFNGNNFLSDAHNPVYKGFHFEVNAFEFKNFTFGGTYEYNLSEVEKQELAGNFNHIKLNHYAGYIGYKHNFLAKKFTFNPKILIGDIKTKQKATGYYATNNGNYWGINAQINYNFSDKFAVFGSIGYNFYKFKVATSNEYIDYFNKASALNFSLGLKF